MFHHVPCFVEHGTRTRRPRVTTADLPSWLARVGAARAFETLAGLAAEGAVVAVDGQGRVAFWGGRAESLLGWRGDEVLGRACPEGLLCEVGPDGPEPRPFGTVVELPRHDGTPVRVRQVTHVFPGDAGALHVLTPTQASPSVSTVTAPPDAVRFHGLLTRAPAMIRAIETIRNVAETDVTVLVRGESGTGKELVARALHAESRRADGPFVAVNCGALAPTLLEDELFGHVRGAFTGAEHDRAGIFAQADGGTLFLDEVAELAPDLQTRLLRVLQERTVVPLGAQVALPVDLRVVAATHRSLRAEVRAGRFREDLLYRLRVVPLFLPPLRERREDVDLLLRHAIAEHNLRGPRRVDAVTPEAMRALLDHGWPGNVRELLNVVDYAFAVGRGAILDVEDLPPELRESLPSTPAPSTRSAHDARRAALLDALAAAGGDLARAAELLGVSRTTLWRWRKELGLG
ncbi:MAG: sigma 54-interacting transcriptional regulator [Alphaproteobacteria bacterium]|nr:sigma 54-interacting transcriptional regulator [Alphaproteobacteria bacterium]